MELVGGDGDDDIGDGRCGDNDNVDDKEDVDYDNDDNDASQVQETPEGKDGNKTEFGFKKEKREKSAA